MIGNGMAATRVVEEILARAPGRFAIILFGEEPHGNDNRIQLAAVLGGFKDATELLHHPFAWYERNQIRLHAGVRAERIDRSRRVVVGRPASHSGRNENGNGRSFVLEEPYDKLILATGSQPFVPPIEGTDKDGVFVFRTLEDCAAIAGRARKSQKAAVIGGGLLGLEAARGLLSHGVEVAVVEGAPYLMGQQLDPDAGAVLRQHMERLGVRVLLEKQTGRILGNGTARGLEFTDGSTLEADLVVLSGDIQANVALAREAGLSVNRGVVVDDQLRTSDPNIFAVGECAEHRGKVYGLVAPLYEQSRVLGDVITGANPGALYEGTRPATILKVLGVDLASMGEVNGSALEASPPAPALGAGEGRKAPKLNNVELMKLRKDGLDVLPDIWHHAVTGNWQEMTEDDKQRFKWQGLFFRKQTPGHFMLRIRMTCGFTNARQFRVIADLSDQYGKGFCDLTTRQQIQMRWFTIQDVPEIGRRLEEVGLNSKQTGMDNVRGVCGCPAAGLTPHELFDAAPVAREFTEIFLDNREYTNLPRKFNVTITGCLENCCHTETQDLALVPSYRELDGRQVNGFNVRLGGKQGSGGYTPAANLDVFVRPEEAARLCSQIVCIFRDHGSRETRTRARLAFLLQDRGVAWFRVELERRWGRPLHRAGPDLRKKHHVDHLGIHPQKSRPGYEGPPLYSVGLLVPVGRITTAQMRGVADLAERYGSGDLRLTVQQNLILANVPEARLGALTEEPLVRELPFDPSPIMRGLVSCTGMDYCHFALIETKAWAIQVAQELERRTQGRKIAPLTIHWSGCPAGCGLHQVGTIGLQGCRARVNGHVMDAAHVYVDGKSGPQPQVAKDLLYDVPCEQLADALEPLVKHLPR
ncbi:MAG: FAD-dependent oxidoreductase [Gemmataceae bacterium]|nr:FAD-dependent oxidoreductase [Gemmataceae bacterium]